MLKRFAGAMVLMMTLAGGWGYVFAEEAGPDLCTNTNCLGPDHCYYDPGMECRLTGESCYVDYCQ